MDDQTLWWLAGLLEGEGSFIAPVPSSPRRPIISLSMTDEDVVARVADLWGVRYHAVGKGRSAAHGWKVAYRVMLRGHPAARLMQELRPLMGKRRQHQIDTALATYQAPVARLLTNEQAWTLARRYWAGERSPTALGREFGVSKNVAIYYINKHAVDARAVEHLLGKQA